MKTIYFAHPVNTYGTAAESLCLKLIAKEFPEYRIFNPNAPEHQIGYKNNGMDYFFNIVKECAIIIFLPFSDGTIGAGVYGETLHGFKNGSTVYLFKIDFSISKLDTLSLNHLSVEQTRERIKNEENYVMSLF